MITKAALNVSAVTKKKVEECRNYAKRMRTWLKENDELHLLWLVPLPIVGFFIVAPLFSYSKAGVDGYGVAIQILGLVPTINGIGKIRGAFELPTFRSAIIAAWKNKPPWKPTPITLTSRMAMASASGGATLVGVGKTSGSKSTEERLDELESEILEIRKLVTESRRDTAEKFAEVNRKISDVHSENENKITAISEKVKAINIDGVVLVFAGAVWIVIGLVFNFAAACMSS